MVQLVMQWNVDVCSVCGSVCNCVSENVVGCSTSLLMCNCYCVVLRFGMMLVIV